MSVAPGIPADDDHEETTMTTTISQARRPAPQSAGPGSRPAAGAGYAIRAEGLVRQFGGVRAVDGVDLRIPAGEIYGFLGPNGAGKSTTVRVLCTLLAPSGGRALVAGYDVASHPGQVRLRIGVALQDVALDPKQTGIELLRLQGRLYGMSKRALARRLAVAAALVHNPEIVFLDEPTTGLDPASRARVWSEIRRLNQELGITIFLTTQYLEEADELAGRVGIIDHGSIVAEGTPAELKRSVGSDVIVARLDGDAADAGPAVEAVPGVHGVEAHGHELVIATSEGATVISQVAVALAGTALSVRELTLRTPTLDDVFLELTGTHIERKNSREDPS